MYPTRRRLLGTAAAALAVAGCVTDDGDSGADDDGGTATPTATDDDATTGTDDAETPTVRVGSHPDHGDVLVGPEELTLYMFDQDTRGESASTCYDGCAENWPPLTVDGSPRAGDGVAAELTTFERDDSERQVAANGWPLYYFAGDEEPGDANGQALNDVWWVLDPDGTPIRGGDTSTETATDDSDDGGAGEY